jgi:hypothetical protein
MPLLTHWRRAAWMLSTLILVLHCATPATAQIDDFERPPIAYSDSTPDNAISRLQDKIRAGDVTLAYEEPWGYLRSLLAELKVPETSQSLVFSKTSLQRRRIGPRTPRAIYFNDDVYVGYCCNGDLLELSVADANLGTVYYTIEQRANVPLKLVRQTDNCLTCHAGGQTRGVPGHIVRSMYVDKSGQPMLASGSYRVDHTSPLANRWGGWYVTGTHGEQRHLGNGTFRSREETEGDRNPADFNLTHLAERFDSSSYVSAHSDLVALMVFNHQVGGHNVLTKALFSTKSALHREEALNRELNEPEGHRWDSTNTILKSACDSLLKYFLISEEAKLTAPVAGTTDFAKQFAQPGPRDAQGRSLRDLDLSTRLFQHPCSYLVYTESFDALPEELRQQFWTRLGTILTGADTSPEFAHLTATDRQAIREILTETKPEAAATWGKEAAKVSLLGP